MRKALIFRDVEDRLTVLGLFPSAEQAEAAAERLAARFRFEREPGEALWEKQIDAGSLYLQCLEVPPMKAFKAQVDDVLVQHSGMFTGYPDEMTRKRWTAEPEDMVWLGEGCGHATEPVVDALMAERAKARAEVDDATIQLEGVPRGPRGPDHAIAEARELMSAEDFAEFMAMRAGAERQGSE